MYKPYFSLLKAKIRVLSHYYRLAILTIQGLKFGKNLKIGKIICEWPHKIVIGDQCVIQDFVHFKINHPFDEVSCISIGNNVFIGSSCEFNCSEQIVVGDNCMIGSNTTIVDVSHSTLASYPIYSQPVLSKKVELKEDVWIGTGCIILTGVTIGKGSVIGAGSLINKSIPTFQVWAGSPARFIKNRI